jgi:hypothetical protein
MTKSKFDSYTDWILEHYKDYHNCPELIKALYDNFGLDTNVPAIKYWFDKRFGMTTVYGRNEFSDEEKEFIKKYYPDHGPEETTKKLNDMFHSNRTINSVKDVANNRLGVFVSDSFINHMVKIGRKSKKSGSIRKETYKDGRIYYKMKSDNGTWKMAGTVIWEKAHGLIPNGYRLIYLDGDNSNYELDNLYLATYRVAYQVVTNKHYQTGEPEITKSLIKYYELRNTLGINWEDWKKIEQKLNRR